MDPQEQQPPEPSLPPAEQMRARRLAKLGGAAAAFSAPTTTSSGSPSSGPDAAADRSIASGKPSPRQSEAGTAPPQPPSTVAAPPSASRSSTTVLSSRPAAAAVSETTSSPDAGAPHSQGTRHNQAKRPPTAPDIETHQAKPRPQKMPKRESPEEWADQAISQFFRVTVEPERKTDAFGHSLAFLTDLHEELQESGAALRLSVENLDSIIMAAGTAFTKDKPLLDYLLPCWKRIIRFTRTQRDSTPERRHVLKEAKRLCMSYIHFALTMPDLFGREENPKHDTLVPYLLRDMDNEHGVCLEFMSEAVSRFQDDESFQDVFVKAMVDISTRLAKMTFADNYKPHMNALTLYSKFNPLMIAVAKSPVFLLPTSAPNIEKMTILGPFFRLSPLQQDVAKSYFPNPTNLDEGRIKNAQSSLQATSQNHQSELLDVVNSFVRVNVEVRNRILDWFALSVNSNHKRRAMQVNPKEVSSDGFMLNVTAIMDELCQPFMDTTFNKINRIDIDYLRRSPRVNIADETKLNADQSQADAFYGKKVDGDSNFISEVFFLALAAHNYGTQAISDKLKNMDRAIDNFKRHIEAFEAERPRYVNNPQHLIAFDERTRRYREALDMALAGKHAALGVLCDEKMQLKSLQFMRYVNVWLLRVASKTEFSPGNAVKMPIPLSSSPPEAWSCLPEYALQVVLDSYKFISNYLPHLLTSPPPGDELMVLCIALLESSDYIRNPYMKSSLVSLLYFGVLQIYRHRTNGVMTEELMSSKFANEHLLHALMKFYIECESTGAHTQFYDKFNIRFEIFYVLQKVWPNKHYHRQLIQQSKTNRPFFVRFVNLLLNDATYVLDEALTKFHKMHEIQEQLKALGLSEEDRQAKLDELKQLESNASNYMHLTNQTMAMMLLFSEALADSFTMPEIVQRLASMLDYNLETLVGPKSSKLKVDDPTKYRFDPKRLLTEIVDIFLNLGTKTAFIEAVASDGRAYKPETFAAATRILGARGLLEPAKLAAFNKLAAKFAAAKVLVDEAEQDLGEIPAEFEDPLMSDLMKDPVQLPSGNVVDRSTIMQHLLSDPKDPFTRQPMTIEDVVPQDDLRQKIEAWKAERIHAAKQQKLEAIADDAMDATE